MKRRIAIIVGGLVAAGLAFLLRSGGDFTSSEEPTSEVETEALDARRVVVGAWLEAPGHGSVGGPTASRLRRRVEIQADGSAPVATTPDEVVHALLSSRGALARCLVDVSPDQLRSPSTPRLLQLHVDASGAVDDVSLDPPAPEPVRACFGSVLGSKSFDGPMRMTFQLGSPPARVRSDASVPRFLSGDRPVERPELPPHVE